MTKRITKTSGLSIAALLLLASQSAPATERWHTAHVRWIYPQNNGSFVVVLRTDSQYCSNTAASKYYLVGNGYNGVTDEGTKKMYAAVLMAMAMERQIRIAFDDSTPDCAINRLIVLDE